MENLRYSKNGLALTESFEGLRLTAYRDSVGVLTIGYGHTGPDVHEGLTITEEEAETLLLRDVAHAEATVNRCVTVTLTQDEFDALMDFTFNVGAGNLASSTLLRDVNAGNVTDAGAQFVRWDRAGNLEVEGLRDRRIAEARMFVGESLL